MQEHPPQQVGPDLTANMILVFANVLWIFLAVWSTWGIGAVMVLGAVLNHLITRYETGLRRQAAGLDRQTEETG